VVHGDNLLAPTRKKKKMLGGRFADAEHMLVMEGRPTRTQVLLKKAEKNLKGKRSKGGGNPLIIIIGTKLWEKVGKKTRILGEENQQAEPNHSFH